MEYLNKTKINYLFKEKKIMISQFFKLSVCLLFVGTSVITECMDKKLLTAKVAE